MGADSNGYARMPKGNKERDKCFRNGSMAFPLTN